MHNEIDEKRDTSGRTEFVKIVIGIVYCLGLLEIIQIPYKYGRL